MNRRSFITTTLVAMPALALARTGFTFQDNSKAFVVRDGASRFGIPTPFLGVNPNDLKVSTKDSEGQVSAFYYKGVQKVGPGLHAHPNQDEIFYVQEGKYVFQLGNEKTLLETGDLIFLPHNIPHTWVQLTDAGQMYYFLQPAGKMEEFFLKMTEVGGKASAEEMNEIGLAHGILNFGPPLSANDQHELIEDLSNGYVIRSGKGRFGETTLLNGKNPNDLKVSGKDTGGALSVFEYYGRETGGPPLHVHPLQDEVFYVTEGEYAFQCAHERFSLKTGDMIFLPRGVPHAFAQQTPFGKMLFFFQPSGKMEDFFRTMAGISTPPSAEEGARIFRDHEMEIVGPPLQL